MPGLGRAQFGLQSVGQRLHSGVLVLVVVRWWSTGWRCVASKVMLYVMVIADEMVTPADLKAMQVGRTVWMMMIVMEWRVDGRQLRRQWCGPICNKKI